MLYLVIGLVAGVLLTLGFYYWSVGRHKRMKSLTKYVAFSIAVLIIYCIAEMVVSTMSGVSHPDLTTMIGSTFGGEILCCCLVKIFKLREENHE